MRLRYFAFLFGGVLQTRENLEFHQALASPRFEVSFQALQEEELDSEIDHVEEGVAALKERQDEAIQASADSAERRAQKLAESFSGTRRRNVQQANNNDTTAAGDSVSKEKTSFRLPAEKRSLVETKPTECLPESEANVTPVPPEEILEAERTAEGPKGEIEILEKTLERLAPKEHVAEDTAIAVVAHPTPMQPATQKEILQDVLAAEEEVREVESQQQAEANKEIEEELQQLLEEHQHTHAAAAAATAAHEAVVIEEAASASEAEQEVVAHSQGKGAHVAQSAAMAAPAMASECGGTNRSATPVTAGTEAAITQAEWKDKTKENGGNTAADDDGDSKIDRHCNTTNHRMHEDRRNKTDITDNNQREKAERTVGGSIRPGRKPPI